MTTTWGSYDNHLRVGVNATISPAKPTHSDATVKVTWTFYADTDGWNFDDNNETYHYYGTGYDDTWSFDNKLSGTAKVVGTHSETYSISSSSPTVNGYAHLYGTYNGASPTVHKAVDLPNRPAAPPPTTTVPGKPGTPSISSITTSSCHFSGSAVSDNGGAATDEYQVQYCGNSGFVDNASILWGETGDYSNNITGLQGNTKYYVRVRAHNSKGWGAWSTVVSFTTGGVAPGTPGKPAVSKKTATSLTYSWAAAAENGSGTITYTIQRATTSAFTTIEATATQTGTASRTSGGLAPGSSHWYRVKATNSGGDSGWSSPLLAVTLTVDPDYTDQGDYVTLVNNLAHAVGDKMTHLGIYHYRVITAQQTFSNSSFTQLDFATPTGDYQRGPDMPTHATGGTMTIQYPGMYALEFAFNFPEGTTTGKCAMLFYVNGSYIAGQSQKSGTEIYVVDASQTAGGTFWQATHFVHLAAGDTVAFGVYNGTGASMTTAASGLVAHSKVTMVGF